MSGLDEAAEVFLSEATDLQASIERNLLDLKATPDDRALIDALFRELHTLKGSSAMFGFTELSHFVHEFETAFDALRAPGQTAGPGLIRIALQACDHFGDLLIDPAAVARKSPELLAALESAIRQVASDPVDATGGWTVSLGLKPSALGLGVNPLGLLDELRALAPDAVEVTPDLTGLAALDQLTPSHPGIRWTIKLPASVTMAAIDDVFLFVRDDLDLAIVEDTVASASGTTGSEQGDDADGPSDDEPVERARSAAVPTTMRVATERLDELMDRVGELVIAESRLHDLSQSLRDTALLTVAEDIRRLASGMRDTTMSIRMVPIGTLFGRFRRLINDLSEQLDKPIDFVSTGGDTELDKTVIELLADPLVHLLRNSLDHGIETAEDRAAKGKAPRGRIELSASHAGAEVLIRIIDDGSGLDLARIRQKAIAKGLIADGAQLTDAEIRHLVFAPGFSTAETVTELSGRGVGMDVVRSTIEDLRGQIEIESEPGYGTEITLRLPLTLAIIDGLLIEVGGERYTIPVAAIEECVELPPELVDDGGGSRFLNVRGGLVPFIRLSQVFDSSEPRSDYQKVVIVGSQSGRVGVVVDKIVSNNQTVIKQLSRLHAGLKSFSGATILGDGTVALILDVAQLISAGRQLEEQSRNSEWVA